MKNNQFHIINLGCAKNLVDSYSIADILDNNGYQLTDYIKDAEFIIVNTCGFIDIAREESYQTIQQLVEQKEDYQKIIVGGCLTERYKDSILSKIPFVDAIFGTRRWMDINIVLNKLNDRNDSKPVIHFPHSTTIGKDEENIHRVAIQGGSAYVKIADGCRRSCSYCAIPLIKGRSVSRPIDSIMGDLNYLVGQNIKEVIFVAQDTTDYGYDLGIKDGLSKLLENVLSGSLNIPWIRFLYTYPELLTDRLIELIARNANVLPYIDIPLQHAHPAILKSMRRPSNIKWVNNTIAKLRNNIPDIAIRTTFIVGYPGETDEEYNVLEDFIKDIKFDRVGFFKYSFEKGVPAEHLGDPVPDEIKDERIDRLQSIQESISLEINRNFIGREIKVLVEGANDDVVVGRSYRDAPEIDGLVIAHGNASIGEFVNVAISDCTAHDLIGSVTS